MKRYLRILAITIFASTIFVPLRADEGMWPLSEIHKLDLKARGFKIHSKQIYNPKDVSLIDAIVNIGGCTGSFVSSEGLIITNHHCAFPAVQAASSKENDFISSGFLARTKGEEIPARGNTVRITDSYRDVSSEVLSVITDHMDAASRTRAISKKMRELVAETEKQLAGKRAEVSEMFPGKTYVLFIYTFLKDVRLVYVPPRSIGEFGGEEDNWVWPRHTGDFSFMRAYTAPDGSPADFSPNNIPYKPKKFLQVNPYGVDENDLVFILGYPGRTFRHRTSHYLAYEKDLRLPFIVNLFRWQIDVLEKMGTSDRAVAIKHASKIKSLANTEKNYRGKLAGMKKLHLVAKKQEEEKRLQQFIDSDPKRKEKYGSVLRDIGKVYDEMRERNQYEFVLENVFIPIRLQTAFIVFEAAQERQKPDADRAANYTDRNFSRTKDNVIQNIKNYDEATDKIFLREILMRSAKLPAEKRIAAFDKIMLGKNPDEAIDAFIAESYTSSKLRDEKSVIDAFAKSPTEIDALHDPFISLLKEMYPSYVQLREARQKRDGVLNRLFAELIDVRQEFMQKDFIPDANSTLRFTFGSIRGYSPADASYCAPITTMNGIIEKTTGEEPFDTPRKLLDLYRKKDFGKFISKKLHDVPVAILYDLDTTGGNSGSPVMNARGELVGVNFDRTFEATINDYAWNENYSRSIAVDIRYVLWVTQKFAGADFLLKEMGVK